jgi:hypothetical protein
MTVPATRSLAAVLRRPDGEGARLVTCVAGAALPAGAEANAYVNLVIGGATVKAPRLSHAPAPAPGAVAYALATDNFLLYLGTVKTT